MTSAFAFIFLQLLAIIHATAGFASKPTARILNLQLSRSTSSNLRANLRNGDDGPMTLPAIHESIRPVLLSAAAAASIFSSPIITDAAISDSPPNQLISSNSLSKQVSTTMHNPWEQSDTPATTMGYASSSIQISSTIITSPIGELEEGSETGINPLFSKLGQWFLLLYIGVSLLAGGNEVLKRVQKMKDQE